ncbi:hypothetical protein SCUP234_02138 [Seiridium cupressi]
MGLFKLAIIGTGAYFIAKKIQSAAGPAIERARNELIQKQVRGLDRRLESRNTFIEGGGGSMTTTDKLN